MIFLILVAAGTAVDYFHVRKMKKRHAERAEKANFNSNNANDKEPEGKVNPGFDETQTNGEVKIQLKEMSKGEASYIGESKTKTLMITVDAVPYQPGKKIVHLLAILFFI